MSKYIDDYSNYDERTSKDGAIHYLYPKTPNTKYFFDGMLILSAYDAYKIYVEEFGATQIKTLGGCPIYYTWICGPEETEKFYALVKDMTREEFERDVLNCPNHEHSPYGTLNSFDGFCKAHGIDISQEKHMD